MHRPQDIRFRRLTHGILLVVGKDNHVLPRIAKVLVQVCRHVLHIVDAATELTLLAEVVDSDQEGLSLPGAARVLEIIALRGTVTECDGSTWRRRGSTMAALMVGVLICVHVCHMGQWK